MRIARLAPSAQDLVTGPIAKALEAYCYEAENTTVDLEGDNGVQRRLSFGIKERGVQGMSIAKYLHDVAHDYQQRGGVITSGITREEMAEAGIRTARGEAKKRKHSAGPCVFSLWWATRKYQDFKERENQAVPLEATEHNRMMRAFVAEAKNLRGAELKEARADFEKAQKHAREPKDSVLENLQNDAGSGLRDGGLWGLSSEQWPVAEKWIDKESGGRGLVAWGEKLINQDTETFVEDPTPGSTPEPLTLHKQCCRQHPGFCRIRDNDIHTIVLSVGENLGALLYNLRHMLDIAGDFFCISCQSTLCTLSWAYVALGRLIHKPQYQQVWAYCNQGQNGTLSIRRHSAEDPRILLCWGYELIVSLVRKAQAQQDRHAQANTVIVQHLKAAI